MGLHHFITVQYPPCTWAQGIVTYSALPLLLCAEPVLSAPTVFELCIMATGTGTYFPSSSTGCWLWEGSTFLECKRKFRAVLDFRLQLIPQE